MCENSKKNGGGRGSGLVRRGQGGCKWRSEAFVKIQKKKLYFLGGGRVRGVGGGEVGVRVDGNRELKLL